MTSLDIRRHIDDVPMSRFQVVALTVCILLNMLDGFDVLAMAFTASHLAADWHLRGEQLGVLLSAGLFGMGAGSLFIAPLADRYGRRTIILSCLTTIAIGMLVSAMAQDVVQLATLRVLTGIGIGGMLASLSVIASEYTSNRWRSGAISMQSTGYALGATLGGIVAAVLLARFGWRSVFLFGGIVTAVMVPVTFAVLPESLDFLVLKRAPDALDKINRILHAMGRETLAALPTATRGSVANRRSPHAFATLFSRTLRVRTLTIWLAFFLVMASFYFVMSWTPKLLVQTGMSATQGMTGGVLLNVGGIIGCTVLSALSARVRLRALLFAYLLAGAASIVWFGWNTASQSASSSPAMMAVMGMAVVIGAAISGVVGGLYALAPQLYPTAARATGMGWAIGMGRIGAILAPLSVGALLDTGWAVGHLYLLFAVPLLAATLAVAIIYAGFDERRALRGDVAAV